ncbi:MAG: biopolymer transporter ExbD [Zymomonas mobilis subsp. pomaceae]|uniref:Biopolymer transport protein ExbD/TolR n=1 Tax=Zymomonas mobilis subsp. pomaceae (strain ATCC 29192 / DSM 22645 / JCM 10191 / CCUG 17912 / NBRC 13757 / NCIMB 11200 / NRRL B-4491 / Barker I) TaxID=579138 RepID=F8EV75_ZYMMT|nr:biopolymer transporter ExbD [Zymomonas mobilis]AEI38293.1 Biopolymer transport protein ExbD/TolR [Zymomonas mobilis subsp. pomaceae ATCC 29192]MDX5947981.1 biopolymer transporter ExbD [Zymomonas mobilis subsp. pomaceae]GEB89311.1 biopolymer transport protein exbD2 [Zymomonas mobilis subsp. pomaceae]
MAISAGGDNDEPMMDINTTPLIDVMLVLLIMFIITIPIETHAVKINLPQNNSHNQDPIDPVKNKIMINASGTIFWNGQATELPDLRRYLDESQAMNPIPELQLQPDPQVRYDVVDKVLAECKKAQVEKMGFVGNETYRSF